MKSWFYQEELPPPHPVVSRIFQETCLFFDIETTGFSADSTFTYLIGCACRRKNSLEIRQFFAEGQEEEALILEEFAKLSGQFTAVLTYNGNGFDIPYLKKRYKIHTMQEPFSRLTSLDLYRLLTPCAKLFGTENLKQKTMEQFLDIPRKDQLDGGELVKLYHTYLKSREPGLVPLFMIHNLEDVKGMLSLLLLLSYPAFFEDLKKPVSWEVNTYLPYHSQTPERELILHFKNPYAFPKRVSFSWEGLYFCGNKSHSSLSVKFYAGVLKYFYPDCKNYYYLPEEKMAIHKSVAAFVDSNHKRKAKPCECYQEKTGFFLPQYEILFSPVFQREYRGKDLFLLFLEETFSQDMADSYGQHLLATLKQHMR